MLLVVKTIYPYNPLSGTLPPAAAFRRMKNAGYNPALMNEG